MKHYKLVAERRAIEEKSVKDRTEEEHLKLVKCYGGVRNYLLSMGDFKDVSSTQDAPKELDWLKGYKKFLISEGIDDEVLEETNRRINDLEDTQHEPKDKIVEFLEKLNDEKLNEVQMRSMIVTKLERLKKNTENFNENREIKVDLNDTKSEPKEGDIKPCPTCEQSYVTWVCLGEPEGDFYSCEQCDGAFDKDLNDLEDRLCEPKKSRNKFNCCFKTCKYKNEALVNIFKHMENKHDLKVGKDVFQDKGVKDE